MNQRICAFDGCDKPHKARGHCTGHYMQQQLGKPLTALRRHTKHGITGLDRLDLYTDKAGDCWVWTPGKNKKGYGSVSVDGKQSGAHRAAYELAYGPIPKGMQVDHKCHNAACVRPDHLRQATSKQNQENLAGARSGSKSGVRGVSWDAAHQKWRATVMHNGQYFRLGWFATVEEAGAVALAKRLELFTHNDTDRLTVSKAKGLNHD